MRRSLRAQRARRRPPFEFNVRTHFLLTIFRPEKRENAQKSHRAPTYRGQKIAILA